MGLRGEAAIVGFTELPPSRTPTEPLTFTLEQWATLSAAAGRRRDLGDRGRRSGLQPTDGVGDLRPVDHRRIPRIPANFAEFVDLGGATAAAMVWRAAAAVELGICNAVLCTIPAQYMTPMSDKKPKDYGDALYFGASSNQYGSPQAEFEIPPYGNLGQNGPPYGQVARRYGAVYGYDERAMAKIAVDQRVNANHTAGAIWHDKPITVEDVLASPMIADPLHRLEIVMPCFGGASVVVASADLARKSRNRPVWIKGFGEHVPYKTPPTYAEDLLATPIAKAADSAFAMAGVTRADIDVASIYDCYTITVLLSLEDAGFCEKGKGDGVRRFARPDVPR